MKSIRNQLIVGSIIGIFTYILRVLVFKLDIVNTLYWIIAMVAIVPIAWRDYKEHIIPNKYLLVVLRFAVLLFFIHIVVEPEFVIAITVDKLIGVLVGGGIFLITMLISSKGVGAGDVKLYAVIGFLVGSKAVFNVLFYALLIGAISSVVLLLSKKKTRKDALPLAPFTLFGLLVSLCLGV